MDRLRHACALPSQKKCVAGGKGEAGESLIGLRRQQHDAARLPGPEIYVPRGVADVVGGAQVVHPGPPHLGLSEDEATGFDDVDRHAHAGAHPEQAPGILGDIRLEKGEAHLDILR